MQNTEISENKGAKGVTTSIPYSLWNRAHKKVSWSEALQKGINITFKEEDLGTSIWQYLSDIQDKISKLALERYHLEDEIKKLKAANETLKSQQKA